MFKKKCPKCNRKIEKNCRFCPFCGQDLNSKYDKKNYGLLGKDDFDDSFESMFNNVNHIPINKILKTAMKMTEKMMRNIPEQPKEHYNNMDIQFFVNGKRVFPKKTQIRKEIQKPIKIEQNMSKEKAKQFAKLPRKEPKTKMKRLSGKLIYELELPGVKNINDILINQLENSIEIKALSKKKVYTKILNMNLPILNYSLNKENLILELQAR